MRNLIVFFCCVLGFFPASAQSPIEYTISFPNAVHHEAEVSINVSEVPAGILKFRMSRSSPGRYATHEFGKNVYDIKVSDDQGDPLPFTQLQGDVYQIDEHQGRVRISYTVYGNWVDGTYLSIDETHAHLNIPATFVWFPSLAKRPVRLRFNDLGKYQWKVATQLQASADGVYSAPDLQYFMDSPIELSDHALNSWPEINPDGKTQTIHLSTHSTNDSEQAIARFAEMVKQVVKESKAVFGEIPDFDHGTYTFLQDVNQDNAGDGMEHRNSTVITSSRFKIEGEEKAMISTFAHEFFHVWNVERIRPKSLEPFDFSQANMSSDLWFAEGFTQYYGNLVLKRAGLRTAEEYNGILSGILNGVLNSPGAAKFPVTRMSRNAVFVDAGVAVDQQNYANTFTSYYTYGAFVALALDLRLRSEFNLTLDDYMRAVWKAHGKTEIPYIATDLQGILGKMTSQNFAGEFFRKYIHGIEKNDYAALLAQAGLELRKANPGKASIGPVRFTMISYTGKNRVASPTLKGSAAYEAGIDAGDYILAIGDDKFMGPVNLESILEKYKPGQSVPVTFEHKGAVKSSILNMQEDSMLIVVPSESASKQQIAFREKWLSSKIK